MVLDSAPMVVDGAAQAQPGVVFWDWEVFSWMCDGGRWNLVAGRGWSTIYMHVENMLSVIGHPLWWPLNHRCD